MSSRNTMSEGAPIHTDEGINEETLVTAESAFESGPGDSAARQEILDAFGEHDEEVSAGTVQELLERIQQDTGLSQEEVERRFTS